MQPVYTRYSERATVKLGITRVTELAFDRKKPVQEGITDLSWGAFVKELPDIFRQNIITPHKAVPIFLDNSFILHQNIFFS
jgi:hypothetical protein